MKKKSPQAKVGAAGGIARAKSLSPERRSEIAQKAATTRWSNQPTSHNEIMLAVLTGLWSNIEASRKVAGEVFPSRALFESFAMIARDQANEVVRQWPL